MQLNPHQARTAALADPVSSTAEPGFYIVSARKFLVLMRTTPGLYAFAWFRRNWTGQNRVRQRDDWPFPRAIF